MTKLRKVGFLAKQTLHIPDALSLSNNMIHQNNEVVVNSCIRQNGFQITTDKSIYNFLIANENCRGHAWNELYIYDKDEIGNELFYTIAYSRVMPFDFNDKSWNVDEHITFIGRGEL